MRLVSCANEDGNIVREEPPGELIALLERLGLATARQVGRMDRRARGLARGLPLFEWVWVDALAQARILTPFQAIEVKSGRGDALKVGPYVLYRPLPSPGYAQWYLAEENETREKVRLAVTEPPNERASDLASQLDRVAAAGGSWPDIASPLLWSGSDGPNIWVASRWVEGIDAAEWMVHNGRLPPETVLEIARQMLVGLTAVEQAGLCHGDICARGLLLTRTGQALLPQPGLRGVVRPGEGYAHADLAPEDYDYLAPERIAEGTPPSIRGDIYSCGCLWWHLLTGRPPVSGGSSLAKLRSARTARIPDVRRLAPETPSSLAAAVSACVRREPGERPESISRLSAMLGPPTKNGKLALAACVRAPSLHQPRWPKPRPTINGGRRIPIWLVVAGCVLAAMTFTRQFWMPGSSVPLATVSTEAWPDPGQPADATGNVSSAVETTASLGATPTANPPTSNRSPDDSTLQGEYELDHELPEPVLQAAYTTISRRATTEGRADDLVLTSDRPVAIDSLQFQPGQTVRGEAGSRPSIVVPHAGLDVRLEGLRFENIDFIWNGSRRLDPLAGEQPGIIRLSAARAGFHGCSFQASEVSTEVPVAIYWTHPADRRQADLLLPSGQLQISDCVFRRLGTVLACRTLGALAVEMSNVLHLGVGPLVSLDHCPLTDEPTSISLSGVTLRNSGPPLECRYKRMVERPGRISIQASGCALVTQPEAAVLSFVGPTSPDRLLSNVQWTGQGSLVSPEAVIAGWRQPDGSVQVLDDATASIAGLVRSAVEFAGPAESGPDASRMLYWQVPLHSPNPPGIDPRTLAWLEPI